MRIQRLHSLPAPLILISASILAPNVLAIDTASLANHTTNTASGLTIEHTLPLSCIRPTTDGDEILVHYSGTLESDGSKFDSSFDRGVPFSFKLGQGMVIQGWDQGLLDMCVGEERRLIIPPSLGYGDRGVGPIPGGSTLIFETKLMGVVGAKKEDVEGHSILSEQKDQETQEQDEKEQQEGMEDAALPSADIPPVEADLPDTADNTTESSQEQDQGSDSGPLGDFITLEKNECRLLGPFALLVQGVLGLIALLSLVFKRWRERPRRPVKIWLFDVSKQVLGTFLLHVANLGMSMFASGSFEVQGQEKALADAAASSAAGRQPNPCSYYLLNLAIDTTIGIPILIVLLKVFHALFSRTPLANPPESIKSGHYGSPPRLTWWSKQALIYFIGLFGMKLCVLFLFQALPWLGWVGDWALRWTEGNEALQIAFVMFIFPVCMNAIQYYVIDGIIKDKGDQVDRTGFERVAQEDSQEGDGDSRRTGSFEDGSFDEEGSVGVVDEADKKAGVSTREALEEANPTAVPAYNETEDSLAYDEDRDGEGSESRK